VGATGVLGAATGAGGRAKGEAAPPGPRRSLSSDAW
jgi:hypothetical protein